MRKMTVFLYVKDSAKYLIFLMYLVWQVSGWTGLRYKYVHLILFIQNLRVVIGYDGRNFRSTTLVRMSPIDHSHSSLRSFAS